MVSHSANTNRVGASLYLYPCSSVKSVVQFLWLRPTAALRLSVKKLFDLSELPKSATAFEFFSSWSRIDQMSPNQGQFVAISLGEYSL